MSKRVRNGIEYLSLRTARKRHRCETRHTGCAGLIEPGHRYVLAELPPNSEMGNERWWRMAICEPCGRVAPEGVAAQLFGAPA